MGSVFQILKESGFVLFILSTACCEHNRTNFPLNLSKKIKLNPGPALGRAEIIHFYV